ncbi:MAG: DUF5689 domain-containing protein [Bacteroidota bacterium]
MIKRISNIWMFAFIAMLSFSACDKETDRPPLASLDPNSIITIDSLIGIYQHYGESVTFNDAFFEDTERNPTGVSEYNIYANVTMSQESGNIYNQAYIQDETEAINVRFSRSNLLQEDSIRINLKGTTVSEFSGMFQLDSVDAYEHVIRLASDVAIEPEEVGIADILAGGYKAKLVKLNNVQFKSDELGNTFADAAGLNTVNRDLEDCFGNSIIVRTSGYADFASKQLPEGNGSLIAVVGLYRPEWQDYDTWQLYIRKYEEVIMEDPRCGDVDGVLLLSENFSDGTVGEGVDFNGWKSFIIDGSKEWTTSTTGSNLFAQINPFGSGDASNIAWLTSPEIPAQSYQSSAINFETAFINYQHDGLEVYVSYNFDGSNPEAATWTELTEANFATAGNTADTWVGSGAVSIENQGSDFHIGFKYTGSDTDGLNTVFRVDNVNVFGIE